MLFPLPLATRGYATALGCASVRAVFAASTYQSTLFGRAAPRVACPGKSTSCALPRAMPSEPPSEFAPARRGWANALHNRATLSRSTASQTVIRLASKTPSARRIYTMNPHVFHTARRCCTRRGGAMFNFTCCLLAGVPSPASKQKITCVTQLFPRRLLPASRCTPTVKTASFAP